MANEMVSRRVTLLGSILLFWLSTYLLVDSGLDADRIITAQLLVFLAFGLRLSTEAKIGSNLYDMIPYNGEPVEEIACRLS